MSSVEGRVVSVASHFTLMTLLSKKNHITRLHLRCIHVNMYWQYHAVHTVNWIDSVGFRRSSLQRAKSVWFFSQKNLFQVGKWLFCRHKAFLWQWWYFLSSQMACGISMAVWGHNNSLGFLCAQSEINPQAFSTTWYVGLEIHATNKQVPVTWNVDGPARNDIHIAYTDR